MSHASLSPKVVRTRRALAALAISSSIIARAQAAPLPPGLYVDSGRTVYVGVEHTLPDPASNDFFDPTSQRTGELHVSPDLHRRAGIQEESRIIDAAQGRIGLSLYYVGERP